MPPTVSIILLGIGGLVLLVLFPGRLRFLFLRILGKGFIDDTQEIDIDVVPPDVVVAIEFDQGPAIHVDRTDNPGHAIEPE
mgnify:CR=1 FL=1